MVAMRSASEQQLSNDCLTRADVNRDGKNSPSMEVLMTLIWAITVIEREREQQAPELDAASGVGQSYGGLDDLFRPRNLSVFSSVSGGLGGPFGRRNQKSLDRRRRMAFK
jgi:transcriptional activator HAC1